MNFSELTYGFKDKKYEGLIGDYIADKEVNIHLLQEIYDKYNYYVVMLVDGYYQDPELGFKINTLIGVDKAGVFSALPSDNSKSIVDGFGEYAKCNNDFDKAIDMHTKLVDGQEEVMIMCNYDDLNKLIEDFFTE